MKKIFCTAIIFTLGLLAGCAGKPSEANLRDGLKSWLGANHAWGSTFSDKTAMKVVMCEKIDEKVFQQINQYLGFSASDQEKMSNLGYGCHISFNDTQAVPVYAVQTKHGWFAEPIFTPDDPVERNLVTSIFNVTR
jgi:hypothetical protein